MHAISGKCTVAILAQDTAMLYDYLFGLCGGVTKPEDVPERLPAPIESASASHTVEEDTPRSDTYSAGIQGYGAYEKINREIEQENDKLVSVTDFKDSAFDISKQYGDLKLLKQQENYGRGDDTGIVFSSTVLVGEEEEEGAPEPEDGDAVHFFAVSLTAEMFQ